MPLEGTYTWSETPDTLEMVIPLKGVSSKNMDVFLAETIVKVSYPPFLIDVNLLRSIEYNEGSAIRKDGTLYLQLIKKDRGALWGKLLFIGSSTEIAERRNKALQTRAAMVLDHHEAAKKKRWEEEKLGVRKQIELETLERERIEQLKREEKAEEEQRLYQSMKQLEAQKWSLRTNANEVTIDNATPASLLDKQDAADARDKSKKEKVDGSAPPGICKSAKVILSRRLPEPRSKRVAKIRLTPRIFNTPMRESTKKMEQEFLIKNHPYLKNNRLLNNNALHHDLVECSPLWLKAKGDEFYHNQDYMSAKNAYSHAFEQGSSLEGVREVTIMDVQVVANRAACHLQLGESLRCVEDCEYALGKMKNKEEREKLHFSTEEDALMFEYKLISRLCAAQCQLGNFHDALCLLKEQTLSLNDHQYDVVTLWQQDMEAVSSWYESSLLKKKADKKLSEGCFDEALQLYAEALVLQPSSVTALANRSACYMAKQNYSLCLHDCSAAVEIINKEQQPTRNSTFPLLCRSKCIEWKVTIILRQSAAKEITRDFKGALSDIESVIALLDFCSTKDKLEAKRESLMKLQQLQSTSKS